MQRIPLDYVRAMVHNIYMAILKLIPNQCYTLALKYKSGRDVKSNFNGEPQLMYTLSTGDILYLPVSVSQSINELNLGVMEPFLLTKLSTANQISWSIERVPSVPAPPAPGPVLVPAKAELPVNGLPVNGHGGERVENRLAGRDR